MEENGHKQQVEKAGKKAGVQSLLPLFPQDATLINAVVGVQQRDWVVYYFNGSMPIFRHEKEDLDSFRFITSQLVVNGVCKQVEIVKCFGVSDISVKRWVKRYRQSQGLGEFVSKKKPKNSKLTDKIKAEVQHRYSQGDSLDDIAQDLGIKKDTLQKAIRQERIILIEPDKDTPVAGGQTKSLRTQADDRAGMGKACSNALDRVLAATTGMPATINFENQVDLSCAGVLLSLPALLSNGLLT